MSEGPAPGNQGAAYVVDLGERVRLMRDTLINNSNLLISAPVGIILVPILLAGLGVEDYGLWMAALALGSLVNIDFGILASVTRAVAGEGGSVSAVEMPLFVGAAWNTYVVLGFAVATLIGTLGLALTHGLHLSPEALRIAPLIFVLAGLYFWGNQLLGFTTAV